MLLVLPLSILAVPEAFSQDQETDTVNLADCMIDYLDLRETPMDEALRLLSDVSGYNIVPTKEARETEISTFLGSTAGNSASTMTLSSDSHTLSRGQ